MLLSSQVGTSFSRTQALVDAHASGTVPEAPRKLNYHEMEAALSRWMHEGGQRCAF